MPCDGVRAESPPRPVTPPVSAPCGNRRRGRRRRGTGRVTAVGFRWRAWRFLGRPPGGWLRRGAPRWAAPSSGRPRKAGNGARSELEYRPSSRGRWTRRRWRFARRPTHRVHRLSTCFKVAAASVPRGNGRRPRRQPRPGRGSWKGHPSLHRGESIRGLDERGRWTANSRIPGTFTNNCAAVNFRERRRRDARAGNSDRKSQRSGAPGAAAGRGDAEFPREHGRLRDIPPMPVEWSGWSGSGWRATPVGTRPESTCVDMAPAFVHGPAGMEFSRRSTGGAAECRLAVSRAFREPRAN